MSLFYDSERPHAKLNMSESLFPLEGALESDLSSLLAFVCVYYTTYKQQIDTPR